MLFKSSPTSRCSRPGCSWREVSILPTFAGSSRAGRATAEFISFGGVCMCWRRPGENDTPHPFLVANRLAPGSYVSGLSALAFASVIPEYVAEVTSITPGRPGIRTTPLGRFSFRHLKGSMMFGYRLTTLGQGQVAFVAEPEKAILDMIHLHPGGDDRSYIEELRLDFDALRPDRLESLAAVAGTPKLARAARILRDIGHDAPAFDAL